MDDYVIGLYCSPLTAKLGASTEIQRGLLAKYHRTLVYKASPRDESYMRNIFSKKFPEGVFICIDINSAWIDHIPHANTIVLLYPDSIGLGFGQIERAIKSMRGHATIRAINGRCREFVLSSETLFLLRVRRIIETFMLGEVIFLGFFLCITPVLGLYDFLKGRR